MIKVFALFMPLVILVCSCNNEKNQNNCKEESEKIIKISDFEYDSTYAHKLGADEYGMSQYVMAILKTGPVKPPTKEISDSLFRGHMNNIQRMSENGDLVMAGPFMDNSDHRGIYIFNVQTIEEAKKLTETDPAIQYGSLTMDLKPWYGSAALKELANLHKRIQKTKF